MFDSEVSLAILDKNENMLGFLHTKYVDVTETIDGLTGLRKISITHPLVDDNRSSLSRYIKLLTHGNKVWWNETPNGDPCLYVLSDNKTVDPQKNTIVVTAVEVAAELSDITPLQVGITTHTMDSAAIDNWFGNVITPGTIETVTLNYVGVNSPMATLQEIATQGNKEYGFRYEYDEEEDIIRRYLDIVTIKGTVHNTPVEIGYNTQNILLEENESTTAIAAAPTGKPSSTNWSDVSTFNNARLAFKNLSISEGQMIPLYVDSSGVAGPNAHAPYAKVAGQNYVQCPKTDSAGNYVEIQFKEKIDDPIPRTVCFDSSETNVYNLYWACVAQIKANNQPSVVLTSNVLDISKMKGGEPEYYNVGDTVWVKMPGRVNKVQARVIKTSKNPRTPDKDVITIGNYILDFFTDYLDIFEDSILPYR